MEQDLNQQKIMELVVDRVLKKHGVLDEKPELDDVEKKRISEIVQNIKTDVEKFIENANKVKTENDFAQNNVTHEMSEPVQENVVKNPSTFSSNNDVKAAKTFFNRPKR
ncbi:hypothetical protein DS745_01580 [Anaerobacillus alkaliphilus]|uniref:Spore coat protein n=1 Tax=Anaerobacillus alkaliphilus TaxID=1548597 RepID=A0A4Q0VXH9_9BACI|nr:hypothetical protein [Anaerobacillus alkaliphilus]RXJ04102.1 hypothetical protein DS745_01580 [Anaerobacillus alkaliphilus]